MLANSDDLSRIGFVVWFDNYTLIKLCDMEQTSYPVCDAGVYNYVIWNRLSIPCMMQVQTKPSYLSVGIRTK